MGQRSQIYVRYNKGENIVAYHLQWNWGRYMINRAYQLLKYIKMNTEDIYSNFLSNNFEITNGERRDDIQILSNLIQINNTCGSYVKGYDLVKEKYIWFNDTYLDKFNLIPEEQDNNNGILVIDIQEDKEGNAKIKYGFAIGGEDGGNYDNFEMCSAKQYLKASREISYMLERIENATEEEKKELQNIIDTTEEQANYIDTNFEMLEQEEYKAMFRKNILMKRIY